MAKALKTGDRVAWQSSGGGSIGRVDRQADFARQDQRP